MRTRTDQPTPTDDPRQIAAERRAGHYRETTTCGGCGHEVDPTEPRCGGCGYPDGAEMIAAGYTAPQDDLDATLELADALQAARRTYQGDWDQDGTTSVHLPAAIAEQLLEQRDWTRNTHRVPGRGGQEGYTYNTWSSPDPGDSYRYDRPHALQIALAADAHLEANR